MTNFWIRSNSKHCRQQFNCCLNGNFCVYDKAENIVGKGENAGYQHCLLFPQHFQKASFLGALKSGLCGS